MVEEKAKLILREGAEGSSENLTTYKVVPEIARNSFSKATKKKGQINWSRELRRLSVRD